MRYLAPWARWTTARALALEVGALAVLAAVVLLSFRDSITAGLVGAEKDTRVFFYPLHAWIAEEVKAGHVPLWNPYIFTGYPIFADGEMGLAHPLHLALLLLLPTEQAFIWQRVSTVLIAAAAMYGLCRALRLGHLAALLGGLTFSLGSFFASQQHHENVTRTAAWLPLALAFVEWGLHRPGWRRHVFFTGGALALGMAALGLHPQVLAMSLLGFAVFVVLRVALGPVAGRLQPGTRPDAPVALRGLWLGLSRLALIVWVGGYVGGLGLALAAIQILPLIELGGATYRSSNPEYVFATSYALPVQNLVNLVLPYFFRGPDAQYWSLWANWETTLYLGIAPLVLAVFAVAARRREVLVFITLGAGALWLAFASYAQIDLYSLLWQLPGFSAFRAPGRYTYLVVLAGAVLAAFGLQALADAHRGTGRLRQLALHTLIGALAVGCLALLGAMLSLRESLLADPAGSSAWLQEAYLGLRHHEEGLTVEEVYRGLVHSLAPETPRTLFALGAIPLTLAAAMMAAAVRRAAGWTRLALVAMTAVDLVSFGIGLHVKSPVAELARATPAIEFLQRCQTASGDCASTRPEAQAGASEQRVFTPKSVASLEFDRLVPFRIEDVGGYSSVEPRRNYVYWTNIASSQNRLLDLGNVRYIVYPARQLGFPSYRGVPFDPERPLMLGGKGTIGGVESYEFGGDAADRLQVVAGLTRAVDIPGGAVVAEVTVIPRQGNPAVIPLRAGDHVAEWAYDRPDVRGRVQHAQPAEIAFRRPSWFELDGSPFVLYLYYSEHELPAPMQVERIEIRYVYPRGGIELFGLGLYNADTFQTAGVSQQERSKLRRLYADDQIVVMENVVAFPRAYVVPHARVPLPTETPISAMLHGPFDPVTEVMLEPEGLEPAARAPVSGQRQGAVDQADGPSQAATGRLDRPAPAQLLEAAPERVRYRAASGAGGYFVHVASFFPGWRALVDGHEAPVLLANGLFRAVPVGPGEHTVELRYEPQSVELGRAVSVAAAIVGLLTMVGALAARWVQRRRSRNG